MKSMSAINPDLHGSRLSALRDKTDKHIMLTPAWRMLGCVTKALPVAQPARTHEDAMFARPEVGCQPLRGGH